MKKILKPLGLFLVLTMLAPAAVVWDEAINDDLSGSGATPTVLSFAPGINTVIGTMGVTNGTSDPDIFSFVVGPGQSIISINLSTFQPASGVGNGSFIAIDNDTTISINSGASHEANLLVSSPGELLTSSRFLGPKFSGGSSTLSNPLTPGPYTLWFQELATSVRYQLDFTVVPEPTTVSYLGLFLACGLRRRRV